MTGNLLTFCLAPPQYFLSVLTSAGLGWWWTFYFRKTTLFTRVPRNNCTKNNQSTFSFHRGWLAWKVCFVNIKRRATYSLFWTFLSFQSNIYIFLAFCCSNSRGISLWGFYKLQQVEKSNSVDYLKVNTCLQNIIFHWPCE